MEFRILRIAVSGSYELRIWRPTCPCVITGKVGPLSQMRRLWSLPSSEPAFMDFEDFDPFDP